MKKFQIWMAGVIGLLSALALAGTAYLIFIFPKTVHVWAEEGIALTSGQKLLVDLSEVAKAGGLIIMPLQLAIVIACVVMAFVAGSVKRPESN